MRTVVFILAVLVLVIRDIPPAKAQTPAPRPLAVGVTLGGAFPSMAGRQEAGETIDDGGHLNVWVQARPGSLPLHLLLEGGIAGFPTSRMSQVLFEEPRLRPSMLGIASITGNVVLGKLQQGRIRPFLVGGVGFYHLMSETVPNPYGGYEGIEIRPSDAGFGMNAGAGAAFSLRIPGWTTLDCSAAARYHSIFTPDDRPVFIPVALSARLY
jgi:hypothetical protein